MHNDNVESLKSFKQKVFDICFPPKRELANVLTLILSTVGIFLAARTILGEVADVGGTIFALLILILLSMIGGRFMLGVCWFLKKLSKGAINIKLPPLLGMIVVGILLKNIPYHVGQLGRGDCIVGNKSIFIDSIDDRALVETHADDCNSQFIGHDLDPNIARTLRLVCMTVILLMAGLEINPVALKNLGWMVLRTSIIPCAVEVVAAAALSHVLLGFPWTVGLLLGYILAAVAPLVIAPCVLNLAEQGYGVEKGIPTLVIASCFLDDVSSISGFGILLGSYFSSGKKLWELILHGPFEIMLGSAFGVFWGFLAQWLPDIQHPHVGFFRWLIIFSGGLIAMFGSQMLQHAGAGGLATVVMALTAGIGWRREGWNEHNLVSDTFGRMWIILEPVLFALIGTEIQVDKIDAGRLGLLVSVLVLALLFRMIATYCSVFGGDLNQKEKIFMTVALIPKATVQAALGPLFLESVRKADNSFWDTESNQDDWISSNPENNSTNWDPLIVQEKWEGWGKDILTLSVVAILITAPLGAILISSLGVKLLDIDETRSKQHNENSLMDSYISISTY